MTISNIRLAAILGMSGALATSGMRLSRGGMQLGGGKRPRPHKPKRRKRYRGLHKGHPMRRRHGGAR